MNDKRITLKQAATLIEAGGTTNTVMLRGQPGIGKSSILRTLADRMPDYLPCYIDAASLELGDLAMPVIDKEGMVTNFAPSARFGLAREQDRPLLIMLDELGKVNKPVLNMLLPVMLERRLGDRQLPVGSIVFGTTNLDTDGVGDNLPAHALNRMTEVVVDNPTPEAWLEWAAANDIEPAVQAFARDYPQAFAMYCDTDIYDTNPYIFDPRKGQTKQFVSPRSLAKASTWVAQRDIIGDALIPALTGTVGATAARDIEAFISLQDQMPSFARITTDPLGTPVPTHEAPTAGFIMANMLAGRITNETADAIGAYVSRWTNFEALQIFLVSVSWNSRRCAAAFKSRQLTELMAKNGKYF